MGSQSPQNSLPFRQPHDVAFVGVETTPSSLMNSDGVLKEARRKGRE